jgi:hypothetical protein
MKSSVLLGITLSGALKIIRYFEKNVASFFRFKKLNKRETSMKQAESGSLLSAEDGDDMFFQNVG